MFNMIENAYINKYREYKSYFETLGLSKYEISAYFTLLSLDGKDKPTCDTIRQKSESFFKIPNSRIHRSVHLLEKKEFVKKKENKYPHEYTAVVLNEIILKKLMSNKISTYEKEKDIFIDRGNDALDKIVEMFKDDIKNSDYELWRIDSIDRLAAITKDIWNHAKDELLIITYSGDWILNDDYLKSILEDKADQHVHISVLLSNPNDPKCLPTKKESIIRTSEFITKIGGNVYPYRLQSMRMNIVDKKECNFIIWPQDKFEEFEREIKPNCFYTTSKLISEELRDLFFMKCLMSKSGALLKTVCKEKENEIPGLVELVQKISFLKNGN